MAATPSNTISVLKSRTAIVAGTSAAGGASAASSPHTPLSRSVSASLYNSPAGRFRVDDESLLIFEVGARVLRAGFAGESGPRCEISYGPEQLRRLGDYRDYTPGFAEQQARSFRQTRNDWTSHDYELWRPDLRELDLNFVGERIERLVRHVETTYLLLDTRPRKVNLVVPSHLPKLLLELTLAALFNVLQGPIITILASNVMSVMSSGLRSALVVDIGWSETTVSTVFEFREVSCHRTIRAAKMLTQSCSKSTIDDKDMPLPLAEDLLVRLGCCRSRNRASKNKEHSSQDPPDDITVEHAGDTFRIHRDALCEPIEEVFFATDSDQDDHLFDHHDMPLHLLAYQALLQLPIDVRKVCMARIVVVGGASNIPGLRPRLMQELEHIITTRSWNPVKNCGSARGRTREDSSETAASREPSPAAELPSEVKVSENTTSPPQDPTPARTPAHLLPQERDDVLERIHARNNNSTSTSSNNAPTSAAAAATPVEGVLRCIHSLGPWAGASLATSLRLRGAVEVERDRFLASGLQGGLVKPHNTGPAGTGRAVSVSAVAAAAGGGSERVGPALPSWL